jgi:hypothetical protein
VSVLVGYNNPSQPKTALLSSWFPLTPSLSLPLTPPCCAPSAAFRAPSTCTPPSAVRTLLSHSLSMCLSHAPRHVDASAYESIVVSTAGANKNVGVIQLNRPKALNALCNALMAEVADAVDKFDGDKAIGAIVITGSDKAFAGVSVCLSIYLLVCLSVCLSICLSLFLSVCVCVCLPVCLSLFLSVCLCVSLSVFRSFCVSVCLSFFLLVCLFIGLSVGLSVYRCFRLSLLSLDISLCFWISVCSSPL